MSDSTLLIDARGLTKTFASGRGLFGLGPARRRTPVLRGVDLQMRPGEVTGLIGESGSGKTTFGKCLLRIIEPDGGTVQIEGRDWLAVPHSDLQEARARYQMIYQNPYACLNPGLTVRAHLRETLKVFGGIVGSEADDRLHAELARFGMADKGGSYPGELSGGEKRRVSVARTLLTNPRLVVADEPTSGLDASVKADVLDRMLDVREGNTGYLFISHDLDVIRFVSDRILVMYRGRIVEVLERNSIDPGLPHHPYTSLLFEAAKADIPTVEQSRAAVGARLGETDIDVGCPYRPLCPMFEAAGGPEGPCTDVVPELIDIGSSQKIACHLITSEMGLGGVAQDPVQSSPSEGPKE
jgi:oligopeptide transport system ATP-binding protein